VDVAPERFARYVAGIIAAAAGNPSPLATDDLYLACACIDGAPGATAAFEARYGGFIRAALGRVVAPGDCDEVEQQLYSTLLVGTAMPGRRIAQYSDRATLSRWLQRLRLPT
jgi:RNA polymerase sigma-70 factor (ECF subfamily)